MLRRAVILALLSLLAPAASVAQAGTPEDRAAAFAAAVEHCLHGSFDVARDGLPAGSPRLWQDALASAAFVHATVGPLDLYVYVADGLKALPDAQKVLAKAKDGLQPAADLIARRFDRPVGLVSGQHLPIVLASGAAAFDELLALLDACDDSGWTRDNGPLFTPGLRASPLASSWDVLLVNLGHKDMLAQKEQTYAHGLGYDVLAHVVRRLLRLGSWGSVPPWIDQGLLDELDIEAYGTAWVGGDWYQTHTDGWYREGWSGFVPEGTSPPAPVTGPPADLATKVSLTGDSWAHRAHSPQRHWVQLHTDLGSAAPASLVFSAEHQSFLPRDRAYARCLWNLLLELAPPTGPDLLVALDRQPHKLPGGMFDCAPITTLFSDWLGGVPTVRELEQMSLADKLEVLRRDGIARELRALGASGMLAVPDHRDEGEWLLSQAQFDPPARQRLFMLILSAEWFEQEAAQAGLAARLDKAMHAALSASKTYPTSAKDKQTVAAAFRKALEP